jgi:guanosine-3',5'-bis(diphosphate) 3'-pyrophosphohydrolase
MWDSDRYNQAIRFAAQWHVGQKVPGTNISYIMHLTQVCQQALLGSMHDPNLDINLVMEVALLHDVLEDTKCPFDTLKNTFGEVVANGVLALSKQQYRNGEKQSKRDQMIDSLDRIQLQPLEIWLVKLADRITNLQEPPQHWYDKPGKIENYLLEAGIIYDRLHSSNQFLATTLSHKMSVYQRFV